MNSTSTNASEPSKRTRLPMRKAGNRPPAPPARQRPGTTSQRRQHQQSASLANAPAREDTKRATSPHRH